MAKKQEKRGEIQKIVKKRNPTGVPFERGEKEPQGSPGGELSAKLTEGWKVGYWEMSVISGIF
jgi:hypothetical protein